MVTLALRVAFAALLVAACDPDSVVEVGEIDPAMFEAPGTASVGNPVLVLVVTRGGGCVSVESTETVATEAGGEVTPYDRRYIPGEGEACTLILKALRHEAWFEFETSGVKTIHIHGRRVVANGIDDPRDELVTIPVQITIQ